MRYAFDVDGTICTNRDNVRKEKKDETLTYLDMTPYPERIQIVNNLYEQGHEIVYWTCLLYTSPSPRDGLLSRMPSSA